MWCKCVSMCVCVHAYTRACVCRCVHACVHVSSIYDYCRLLTTDYYCSSVYDSWFTFIRSNNHHTFTCSLLTSKTREFYSSIHQSDNGDIISAANSVYSKMLQMVMLYLQSFSSMFNEALRTGLGLPVTRQVAK